MAGSQFDARAVASAILAKVRAAHATKPDARAQPADTDRVRFRDSDRSIRVVQAVSLTSGKEIGKFSIQILLTIYRSALAGHL